MVKWTAWALGLAACFLHGTAFAAREDAFSGLIRERIEAFSDASSRGDETGMNKLLADEVLFSSGSGTVDHDPKLDKADATASLLKEQTLALRDAARCQDTTAMKRYVAEEALLVNEEGIVSGPQGARREVSAVAAKGSSSTGSSSTGSSYTGSSYTVAVSEWVLHSSGDVAVASYVGEPAADSGALSHRSLSVETWIKSDTAWKLIASQTIPLYQDPPAVTLSAEAMHDYVGSYSGGPGLAVMVFNEGGGLAASSNGGKAVAYEAEGHDRFFTPGLPAGTPRSRIVFQRDQSGHITGYVSSRGLALARSGSVAPQSGATQPGITSTVLPAAELVVRRFGDVAVATFIHERVTNYYGQVLHAKYRSTETWIKRGTEWKMLTLQSCELDRPLVRPFS